MMKLFVKPKNALWVVAFLAMPMPMFAQNDATDLPQNNDPTLIESDLIPRQPLIPPIPARAEWTVTYYYGFNDAWEIAEDWQTEDDGTSFPRMTAMTVSKDANTQSVYLTKRWSNNRTDSEWIVMGTHVAPRSNNRGYYVVGFNPQYAQGLGGSDFPELNWINMQNFMGVREFKGREVFVFKQGAGRTRSAPILKGALAADDDQEEEVILLSDQVVYLDATTQAPLLYYDGEAIRMYSFAPTPTSRLQPPRELLEMLQARSALIEDRLTVPASPGS